MAEKAQNVIPPIDKFKEDASRLRLWQYAFIFQGAIFAVIVFLMFRMLSEKRYAFRVVEGGGVDRVRMEAADDPTGSLHVEAVKRFIRAIMNRNPTGLDERDFIEKNSNPNGLGAVLKDVAQFSAQFEQAKISMKIESIDKLALISKSDDGLLLYQVEGVIRRSGFVGQDPVVEQQAFKARVQLARNLSSEKGEYPFKLANFKAILTAQK